LKIPAVSHATCQLQSGDTMSLQNWTQFL